MFAEHATEPAAPVSGAGSASAQPPPAGAASGAHGWTIEELAARSGMTVRNIRSHRARDLMAAPHVHDRVGYYGEEHLARLRLIQELQSEGFNLSGIKRLLVRTNDQSERLLDLKHLLGAPLRSEQAQVFTADELVARFGAEAGPEALNRAQQLGMLVPIGEDRFEAPVPSLLDMADEVVSHGVPLPHVLSVIAKVQDNCATVAREFVRLFMEDLWKPFAAAGYPQERWSEVVEAIERLRPVSSEAVVATYQMVMTQAVEKAFGRELQRLSRGRR